MRSSRLFSLAFTTGRIAVSLALTVAAIGTVDLRLAPLRTAWAATEYIVNLTTDTFDGICDADCTLRDAIDVANVNAGADLITFSSAVTEAIVLSAALPVITDTLTIDGSGQTVIVDGDGAYRVFSATMPLTLTVLTVQNGGGPDDGGGAYFGNSAVISAVTFISNTAVDGSGGGAFFAGPAEILGGTSFIANEAGFDGGGAWFTGTTTVTGASFINNYTADGGGGAIFKDTAAISGSVFSLNTAETESGGLIFDLPGTITNTNFLTNTSGSDGGGAYFQDVLTVTASAFSDNLAIDSLGGGAHFACDTTVIDTTFTGNTALGGGGAFFECVATMSGGTFTSNFAEDGGGAVFDGPASVTGTTFISNTADGTLGGGGALFGDTAALTGTAFLSNTTSGGFGGGGAFFWDVTSVLAGTFISNTANSFTGGGALFYDTASVVGSTFISNTSDSTGGGAYVGGDDSVLTANLFQGNQAADAGGGVYVEYALNTSLNANRLFDNVAGYVGGALFLDFGAEVNLDNNLIAANTLLNPGEAEEIGLDGEFSTITGRHNTLAAAADGSGVAISAGAIDGGQVVLLTNSIISGYAVGVLEGPFTASQTLDGVLWAGVTTPTQGSGITITHAYTGAAAFADAAGRDYHLTLASAARDVGEATALNVDFEGDPRPVGAGPDLGADEYFSLTPVAPTAGDDSASTPEETAITLNVLANDSDLNNDPLTISAVGTAGGGTAVVSGTTQIVYTPVLDFNGPSVFTYTVSDGTLTATGHVTVTVTPVNDNPTISAIGDLTIPINTNTGAMGFRVGDVDTGDILTVTAVSGNLTLVPNANIALGGSGIDRTATVTPSTVQTGSTLITLTVNDGHGGSAQESFTLTVVAFRLALPYVTR